MSCVCDPKKVKCNFLFQVGAKGSPTFTWLEERSEDGIPLLEVHFTNNKDDDEDVEEVEGDSSDLAVLSRYNPIPVELDESRSPVDQCIFKGFLLNEPNAQVALTGGCPGDNSFDVI
jgi:hypothetical protein